MLKESPERLLVARLAVVMAREKRDGGDGDEDQDSEEAVVGRRSW